MNYLVVHRIDLVSGISIESGGRTYDHQIKCWAIRTGSQAQFVNLRMARFLQPLHLFGTYEQIAKYAITFEEMVMLMERYLGPDDEARYLALCEERPKVEPERQSKPQGHYWHLVWYWLRHLFVFLIHFTWHMFRFVLFVLVFPFIIKWFHRKDR